MDISQRKGKIIISQELFVQYPPDSIGLFNEVEIIRTIDDLDTLSKILYCISPHFRELGPNEPVPFYKAIVEEVGKGEYRVLYREISKDKPEILKEVFND